MQARLVEATPAKCAAGHVALAAPAVLFLGWLWLDLALLVIPLRSPPAAYLLGAVSYVFLVLLPLGYGAHRLVTSFPGLFQQAGWVVHPLEPLGPSEQYSAKFTYVSRERARTGARRILLRVAQGWVYLEIGAVLAGAVAMVPLFFSAVEYGFGR